MNEILGDDLVSTALIGTARRAVDTASVPGKVGDLARAVHADDPATALLNAAAVVAIARRAGTPHATATTLPPVAPVDARPAAPPAAAARLASLLPTAGANADPLLLTWLGAAARAGYRAPDQHLPALLDLAAGPAGASDVRPAVAAVLGERGRWLAAHRPDWAARVLPVAPTGALGVDVWAHGTALERVDHFAQLRGADPDGARDLLEQSWTGENAEQRAAFLACLRAGLTAADELLLDRARGDRAAQVRATAVALLALLPGAAFTQAVTARATASLRVERRRLRRTILVTWPTSQGGDSFTKAPPGTGERAWLLRQLIRLTPLAVWTTHLGATADELVAMPVADDAGDILREGWVEAAVAQHDPRWAAALLGTSASGAPDLVAALPAAARAEHLATLLRADKGTDRSPQRAHLAPLLATSADPWPTPLVQALVEWVATPRHEDHQAVTVLDEAARHLPATQAVEAALRAAVDPLPPQEDAWRQRVHRTAHTVHTRRLILEELP